MEEVQRVGARVQIVQDRATVRYIGSVTGQEGVWVGVEWDDPTRGKHDGSTGGVRYFETLSGPTAGSFIRIEKVDFGKSVPEALHLRYTNERGELGDVAPEDMYVHTVRQHRVQIEVVGVEKIKALQSMTNKLVSARLVGAHVSHVVSYKWSIAATS
jgi:tubulin-specific chaperone E